MPKNFYDDGRIKREDTFGKSIKIIFFIIIFAVFIKWGISSGTFYRDSLSGPGYTMEAPEGWEKVPKDIIEQMEDEDTTVVAYVTPDKNPATQIPYAQIIVYTIRLPRSMWMEDEYPTIISSIKRAGLTIIDKGELKLGETLFKWVLTDNKHDDVVSLQFFHIAETKKFYKIIYSSSAKYFNKYRPVFDYVKDTFHLKFGLY